MTASKTREEFEAWYVARQRSRGFGEALTDAEFVGRMPISGRYMSLCLEDAWAAYQAARRATLEQLMLVCGELLERAGNEDQSGLVVAIAAIRALAAEDDQP